MGTRLAIWDRRLEGTGTLYLQRFRQRRLASKGHGPTEPSPAPGTAPVLALTPAHDPVSALVPGADAMSSAPVPAVPPGRVEAETDVAPSAPVPAVPPGRIDTEDAATPAVPVSRRVDTEADAVPLDPVLSVTPSVPVPVRVFDTAPEGVAAIAPVPVPDPVPRFPVPIIRHTVIEGNGNAAPIPESG